MKKMEDDKSSKKAEQLELFVDGNTERSIELIGPFKEYFIAMEMQAERAKSWGFYPVGLDETKRSLLEAQKACINDPWYKKILNELDQIYKKHIRILEQRHVKKVEEKIRKIGEQLNQRGGIRLMVAACTELSLRHREDGTESHLTWIWDRIGGWMA